MDILLKALIIAGSTLALLSLSVCIYLAVRGDSVTLYSAVNNDYLSTKQKIFLVFAAIGFLVCIYSGVKAMLFWMPSEWGRINSDGEHEAFKSIIASVFTFVAGFSFIHLIDKAAHKRFDLRRLRNKSYELKRLLNASEQIEKGYQKIVSELLGHTREGCVNEFSIKKEELKTYRHFIFSRDGQGNKVNGLVSNAIDAEIRSREEKEKQDKEKEVIRKKNEENACKTHNYLNVINDVIKNNNFKIVNSIDSIEDGRSYLIDPKIIERKWKVLDVAANVVFALDENMIGEGGGRPINVNSFFKNSTNARVIDKVKIMARYTGDSHGGHTELYSVSDGGEDKYLSGIRFVETIDGLIESLYIGLQLPIKGVYWHGLYGRDYEFLLNNDHFVSVLCRQRPSLVSDMVDKLELPAGIRVVKSGGRYKVSCLVAYQNGSIVDMSISISNGIVNILPGTNVLDSKAKIFY